MEERAQQNGFFFIPFVMFNSTLVYSVVWNQPIVCYKKYVSQLRTDTVFCHALGISPFNR